MSGFPATGMPCGVPLGQACRTACRGRAALIHARMPVPSLEVGEILRWSRSGDPRFSAYVVAKTDLRAIYPRRLPGRK